MNRKILFMLIVFVVLMAACNPPDYHYVPGYTIKIHNWFEEDAHKCYSYKIDGRTYHLFDEKNNLIGSITPGKNYSIEVYRNNTWPIKNN